MAAASIKECKNDFHLKAIEKRTQMRVPVCRISSDCKQFLSKAPLGGLRNAAKVTNGMVWIFSTYEVGRPFTWQAIFRVNTCCSSTLEIRVAFHRAVMAIEASNLRPSIDDFLAPQPLR